MNIDDIPDVLPKGFILFPEPQKAEIQFTQPKITPIVSNLVLDMESKQKLKTPE
ncbi:hypothetical protein SS50377_27106 [Spironucleus salmonicida]|uniref:Uncharacterized protein n=1 Tax=Spironucleus salmonicida TaxID=348837 RepID=A0A9P8RVM6_9EUKA|nr:hypothetical protein SS50377_27099 [Spironucleus salmonicida]KAH0570815.1 hypothetical protein SS50377_27106 [Spironucleus salmonicida]